MSRISSVALLVDPGQIKENAMETPRADEHSFSFVYIDAVSSSAKLRCLVARVASVVVVVVVAVVEVVAFAAVASVDVVDTGGVSLLQERAQLSSIKPGLASHSPMAAHAGQFSFLSISSSVAAVSEEEIVGVNSVGSTSNDYGSGEFLLSMPNCLFKR